MFGCAHKSPSANTTRAHTAGFSTTVPVTWEATALTAGQYFNLAAVGTNVLSYISTVASSALAGAGSNANPYASSAMSIPSTYASTAVIPKITVEKCAPTAVGAGSTCLRAGVDVAPGPCAGRKMVRKLRL